MRSEVGHELRRAAALDIGMSDLDAYLYSHGTGASGRIGAGASYHHRLRRNLAAFASAEAGAFWGDNTGLEWRVLAGIRGSW